MMGTQAAPSVLDYMAERFKPPAVTKPAQSEIDRMWRLVQLAAESSRVMDRVRA